ncbi:QsdR family transcriptional regulator [Marinobacter sp. S6332]|uniref:QsdR family transcriptional regulator n=1 Tax=Marinobacter sp. S6332 TaxID=2926403 RepID=UPI001FF61683|nr:QsdR family transcriptional regulator [Marinobacter sp. S6332]MCK0165848.1 QsdR family transcriptional regulator [Marinobacter sp. S6332]
MFIEEQKRHALTISPETLAYIIIHIGESFLYPHLSDGIEPDLDRAMKAVRSLLR